MSARTVVGFDTSTINKLEDDGSLYGPMMAALASGFRVRLPAICLEEVLSTPKPERRDALFFRCAHLIEVRRVCLATARDHSNACIGSLQRPRSIRMEPD